MTKLRDESEVPKSLSSRSYASCFVLDAGRYLGHIVEAVVWV